MLLTGFYKSFDKHKRWTVRAVHLFYIETDSPIFFHPQNKLYRYDFDVISCIRFSTSCNDFN